MVDKISVSVYILTFNNLRTIERCLRSLHWAEELVVVDSGSTDGTYEICQRHTDKLYLREFQGHRDQYQYAADLTTRQWVMFVDADEEVPPELVEEIGRMLKDDAKGVDGFFVYRRTYYLGRWIRYGGWNPDGEIRLYRRDKGKWEGGLHAKIVVVGKVSTLKNQYLHYTYQNISDQIQTIDRYSSIAAKDMISSAKRFHWWSLLFHPPFRFFKDYILKLGFLDGLPGLIIATSTVYYTFIKHAKLWEYSLSSEEKGSEGVRICPPEGE